MRIGSSAYFVYLKEVYIMSRYHLYPFALVQSKDYVLSPVLGVLDTFHLLKYLDVPGEPVSSQEVGEQGKPVTKRNEESENEWVEISPVKSRICCLFGTITCVHIGRACVYWLYLHLSHKHTYHISVYIHIEYKQFDLDKVHIHVIIIFT